MTGLSVFCIGMLLLCWAVNAWDGYVENKTLRAALVRAVLENAVLKAYVMDHIAEQSYECDCCQTPLPDLSTKSRLTLLS